MPTLFDHTGAPPGAQFLDGSPGIHCCHTYTFHEAGVGVAGQVTEVWFYCGDQTGGTWTAVGWETVNSDAGSGGTGTLVANQAFVGTPVANSWNKITLTVPVDIPADYNRRWRFGVHNPQYYWASNGFFSVHDETNGPITAYRTNDTTSTIGQINQGTFALTSAIATYPSETGSAAFYGTDVTFVPSGETPPEDHTSTGTGRATAAATGTSAKVAPTTGRANALAAATGTNSSSRTTTGRATALATATATSATARASSGTAPALAGARAVSAGVRLTAGTARATAVGGSYTAAAVAGPWIVSRNNEPRIVTRAQVAN